MPADVAFALGVSQFAVLREEMIRENESLTGLPALMRTVGEKP